MSLARAQVPHRAPSRALRASHGPRPPARHAGRWTSRKACSHSHSALSAAAAPPSRARHAHPLMCTCVRGTHARRCTRTGVLDDHPDRPRCEWRPHPLAWYPRSGTERHMEPGAPKRERGESRGRHDLNWPTILAGDHPTDKTTSLSTDAPPTLLSRACHVPPPPPPLLLLPLPLLRLPLLLPMLHSLWPSTAPRKGVPLRRGDRPVLPRDNGALVDERVTGSAEHRPTIKRTGWHLPQPAGSPVSCHTTHSLHAAAVK